MSSRKSSSVAGCIRLHALGDSSRSSIPMRPDSVTLRSCRPNRTRYCQPSSVAVCAHDGADVVGAADELDAVAGVELLRAATDDVGAVPADVERHQRRPWRRAGRQAVLEELLCALAACRARDDDAPSVGIRGMRRSRSEPPACPSSASDETGCQRTHRRGRRRCRGPQPAHQ